MTQLGLDKRDHSMSGVATGVALGLMCLAAGFLAACGGCGEDIEVRFDVDESLDEEVVAVARLLDFEGRHFDMQHWLAEGVQAGVFSGRDDLEHSIPSSPTAQVRRLVEESVGEEAHKLDWEGHMDVAVWRPAEDGDRWRWAVSIPAEDAISLSGHTEASSIGGAQIGSRDEAVEVYERSIADGASRFVASVPTVEAIEGRHQGRSVVVSNFAEGTARIVDALELTAPSGALEAELYLWPRRTGLAERFVAMGRHMDQELAHRGHELPPMQVGLMRLQSQFQQAFGTPEAWPEVVRIAKDVERDEETRGATRVEFLIDARTQEQSAWNTFAAVIGDGDVRRRSAVDEESIQFDVDLQTGGLAQLVEAAIPEAWWQVATGRNEAELATVRRGLDEALSLVDGEVTVAIGDSPVPMGLTAETYIAVDAVDAEALSEAAQPVYQWVVEEYWPPLMNLDSRIVDQTRREIIEGTEVELREQAFVIGHGFGLGGFCSGVVGDTYLAYWGVRPCHKLVERGVTEWGQGRAAPMTYRGRLQGLFDTLYASPGEQAMDVFGDIDIDVSVRSHSDRGLRLSVAFEDLPELARVVEGVPRLRAQWEPDELFDPEAMTASLSLDSTRYQEPGLAIMATPGMGGVLPASFFLNMPFSYPPTTPNSYRRIFFTDPDQRDQDHHGHSHPH